MKISISWTTKKQCDFCGGHGQRVGTVRKNVRGIIQCEYCGGTGKMKVNHEKSLKLWES